MFRPYQIVPILAAVALSGCATMFAGGKEAVRIESEPSEAMVTTQNGLNLGTTPLTVALKPQDYVLTFSKVGYNPGTYMLSKKVDGVAFLNLFCILCWGIDFATGALWGLEDEFVKATLTPKTSGVYLKDERLTQLACANYGAVEHAYRAGSMTIEQRHMAYGIVHAKTSVVPMECTAEDSGN